MIDTRLLCHTKIVDIEFILLYFYERVIGKIVDNIIMYMY